MLLIGVTRKEILFNDGTTLRVPNGAKVTRLPQGWKISRGQIDVGLIDFEFRWHILNRLAQWFGDGREYS